MKKFFAVTLLTLCATAGNALGADAPVYDVLYPYYGELCALTKIKKKKGVIGGKGGHAVLYLHGACRDVSAPYPRIQMCDNTALQVPDQAGVGISVDSIFKNVNWIAVESRRLFFDGNVEANESLTEEKYDEAFRDVKERQILRGVKFLDSFLKDKTPGESVEDYEIREMMGTDFAVRFGRHSYCVRVPLSRQMTETMVQFLNGLNEKVYPNEDYHWDGAEDNCTHPIVNAFSKAGLWEPIKTNRPLIEQLFNLAVPANEFIHAAMHGNDRDFDDPLDLFKDEWDRGMILEQGRFATRHGYITSYAPPHEEQNQLYDDPDQIFILNFPLIGPNQRRLERIIREPRYTDVTTNLLYFIKKYEDAIETKERLGDILKEADGDDSTGGFPLDQKNFIPFYRKYDQALLDHLNDARALILRVKEIQSLSVQSPLP